MSPVSSTCEMQYMNQFFFICVFKSSSNIVMLHAYQQTLEIYQHNQQEQHS